MAKIITYHLKDGEENSDRYYLEAGLFAKEWLTKTIPQLKDLVDGFLEYRRRQNLPNRAAEACTFELLVVGVLLLEHSNEAEALPASWGQMLQRMVTFQSRHPKLEGIIKAGRGWVYYLAGLRHKSTSQRTDLKAMMDWLVATGEDTQAQRLTPWRDYLNSVGNEVETITRLIQIAKDFSRESLERLGKFTENIDVFLETEARKNPRRYDAVLRGHTRLEYHLAMVGNAILNRENREAFLKTKARIVILPPCMKAHNDTDCQARMTENGELCAGCTPQCRVFQVTKLGEKHGFGVYIIPEEIRGYAREGESAKVGLVGVSCLLTNWTGGWDAERLGIPAQGILLDYVGCKYHWDRQGFPTDINLHQMLKRVDVSQPQ